MVIPNLQMEKWRANKQPARVTRICNQAVCSWFQLVLHPASQAEKNKERKRRAGGRGMGRTLTLLLISVTAVVSVIGLAFLCERYANTP